MLLQDLVDDREQASEVWDLLDGTLVDSTRRADDKERVFGDVWSEGN